MLKKDELIPNTELKGYVVTKGLSSLDLQVAAKKGKEYVSLPLSSNSNDEWQRWLPIGLLVAFGLVLIFVLYKATPAIAQAGVFEEGDRNPSHKYLFIALFLIFILPKFGVLPSLDTLLSAIGIYLFVTNYKNIVRAIGNLAQLDSILNVENKPANNQVNKDASR